MVDKKDDAIVNVIVIPGSDSGLRFRMEWNGKGSVDEEEEIASFTKIISFVPFRQV